MKVYLYLREGVRAAGFLRALGAQVRAGEHRAWELVRARPLRLRHKGRHKVSVSLRAASRRGIDGHPPADVIASLTGKEAGLVLRYFAGLLALKLGADVAGFYVPVPA